MILKDCLFSVSKLESYVQNLWQGAANWILTIHWIMGKLDSNALPHTITHWWLRRTYKYNHTQHTYCYILHVYCNTIRIIKWYFWRHFSTNPNMCPFVHLSAFQRQVQSWNFPSNTSIIIQILPGYSALVGVPDIWVIGSALLDEYTLGAEDLSTHKTKWDQMKIMYFKGRNIYDI